MTTTTMSTGLSTSSNSITALFLTRQEITETLLQKWFLNFHVRLQRLRAVWYADGAMALKRGMDIGASLALLLCALPFFALVALLIKLEDGGPVFFKQTRIGQFGREFRMYKIRSMCLNAEQRLQEILAKNQHQEGVTFKLKNDPRITRIGRWLRKFSMDELPQLFNVLIGDMSLVGPRPPVPSEVSKYSLAHRRRLAVKPGITCLWQISGRAEIDFSNQVQLDVDYIESQSLWMDLKILVRTIPAVISAKGAY